MLLKKNESFGFSENLLGRNRNYYLPNRVISCRLDLFIYREFIFKICYL